jgi:SDR family mycofactocin-dependent oxidoreductase
MGRFEGKVAFITGAARGQGRSHAVRLAEEGADIIALDICAQIDTVVYPMSDADDLEETARLVKERGRRIVSRSADVRDPVAVRQLVDDGVAQLGRLDLVSANAGIFGFGETGRSHQAFVDAVDVMLTGVWNTVEACIPTLVEQGQGGSIVITSSSAGLRAPAVEVPFLTGGFMGYVAAKHGVVGLMRMYSNSLSAHNIRVNSVHPTGVNSPMCDNEQIGPWLESVSFRGASMGKSMNVSHVEAIDVTNALLYLFSDEARYVTGITLPVDAGSTSF